MENKIMDDAWEELMGTIEKTAEKKLEQEEKIEEKTDEDYWQHKNEPDYLKERKKEVKTKVGIKFLKEIIFNVEVSKSFKVRALESLVLEFKARSLGKKIPKLLKTYFINLIDHLIKTKDSFWQPFDLINEQMSLLSEEEAWQFFDLLDVGNPFFWRGSIHACGYGYLIVEDRLTDLSDTNTNLFSLFSSKKISDFWKKKTMEKFHRVIIEDVKKGKKEQWFETPLAFWAQLLYRSSHLDDLAVYFNKEKNFDREIEFLLENIPDSRRIFGGDYEFGLVLGKIEDRELALSFLKYRCSKNKKDNEFCLSDSLISNLKEFSKEFPDDQELKGIIERQDSIEKNQEARSKKWKKEKEKEEKSKKQKISQSKSHIGKIEKEATKKVEKLLTLVKK